MGAGFSLNIKCPEPFVSLDAVSCVMPCPADKKFIRKGKTGEYKCVYAPDEQYSVDIVTVGAVPFDGTTLEELRAVNSQKYTEFSTEKDRFEKALITVYANIDKQQKINDAFKDLQAAENARDQSPSAYQAARTAYYTLVKGAGWLEEEKQRIAKAEVDPEVQRYKDAVDSVQARTRDQQKTLDVVNGIKDKVLSLRDDFRYSVNTFQDQIEKVKMQISMENRTREKEDTDTTSAWINTILNVLLVVVLAYAAYVLVRKVLFPHRFIQPAVSVYTRPTYTA
jgi:hypothetical protein